MSQVSELTVQPLTPARSLRDKALDILRGAVVTGQIRPGDLYSATALAKELGVSVSPVREAMLTLVNEGTMEAVRNRGFRLIEPSDHDIAEVAELRMLLEPPSVARLADLDLDPYRDRLEQLVVATERATTNAAEFLSRDSDFHLGLIALLDNQRLVDLVARLRTQTRIYGIGPNANAPLRVSAAQEHRDILERLLAGDGEGAERVMRAHLGHIRHEWLGTPGDAPRGG